MAASPMNKIIFALVLLVLIALVGVFALTQIAVPDDNSAIALLPTPTPLPRNGLIKFISTEAKADYIYTINPDGSDLRLVTNIPIERDFAARYQTGPILSPDGTRIAFPVDEEGNVNLYVMDIDGSNVQRLTANTGEETSMAWSPDSRRLVFHSSMDGDVNGADIYVIDADGQNLNRLTDQNAEDIQPSWSPDGRWITFASKRPIDDKSWTAADYWTYMMDPEGRNVQRIVESPVGWLARSPDGQQAFVEGSVIDMNTQETRTIVDTSLSSRDARWSPDGRQIAFISKEDDLYLIRSDGTSLRLIAKNVPGYAWSPDGAYFVFNCGEPYPYNLCIIQADGTHKHILELNLGLIVQPEWQPIWD